MKTVFALAALAVVAGSASAQYVLRGEFNAWGGGGDIPLIDMGGGMYSGTVTGLTPGGLYEYKATTLDWSFNGPGSNARAAADASGVMRINWFPSTSWADGWQPSGWARVGYEDSGTHGWDLMGSVNGWAGPFGTLSNMGGGLYSTTIAIAPGSYEFKFRKDGDWAVSIGDDFGNSAANIWFTAGADPVLFELDLPNGRWRVSDVPTPGSLALMGLAGLAVVRRRR
ncbi:MAG: hypothetical protein KF787_06150 [Phycisphaeraceae bacterium]|nr:hypothetical protein [Phycisphaerae bacterium]MBX3392212.1 hypothetical protein [Phycisphaeraceae bacterium]HRJ49567.1 MYXO-CTERM sorting domain-containing protein [Phycisphaerales bacterium]